MNTTEMTYEQLLAWFYDDNFDPNDCDEFIRAKLAEMDAVTRAAWLLVEMILDRGGFPTFAVATDVDRDQVFDEIRSIIRGNQS
jgi:hypothetical protein